MAVAIRRRSIQQLRADGRPRTAHGLADRRFDDMLIDRLCQALLAGNTYMNACHLVSLDKRTFYRWMQEGATAEEGTKAREVYVRLSGAVAEAEHRNLMLIQKAAKTSWQAAAWFLERRNPTEYGRRERVEVGNADGTPFVTADVTEQTLNDDEKLAALRGILRRKPDLMVDMEPAKETVQEQG